MTQTFRFYVLTCIFVWLIGVMRNLIFCQETTVFPQGKIWLENKVLKKEFKRFTQTGLIPYFMSSTNPKKDKNAPCPFDSVHLLVLIHAFHCSNQCENIYPDPRHVEHVDNRKNLRESRLERPKSVENVG